MARVQCSVEHHLLEAAARRLLSVQPGRPTLTVQRAALSGPLRCGQERGPLLHECCLPREQVRVPIGSLLAVLS